MSAGCLDTRLARDLNPGTTQTTRPGSAAQCLHLLLLAPPRSSCVCSNCLATTVHPGDPAAMSAVTAWPLQFTWATLQLCLQQLPGHYSSSGRLCSRVCSNCLATTVHPGDAAAVSAATAWPLQFIRATLQLCLQQLPGHYSSFWRPCSWACSLPSHCPPPAGDNNKTQDK